MQGTSFVVLAGHLNDYPLASLLGILHRQRKTGRLLIEYPAAPCSLYFEDGHLVDAQLNQLTGLQAIYVALAQPGASFNFNPLIQPSRRSIDAPSRQVLMESLGCPQEKMVSVQASRGKGEHPPPPEFMEAAEAAMSAPLEARQEALPSASEVLALPAAPVPEARRMALKREVFSASAIILSLVSLLAIVALVGERRVREARPLALEVRTKAGAAHSNEPVGAEAAGGRAVEVVLWIENGRVRRAAVANPQAGMEAYQALALRIARSRRYPAGTTRQETISIEIKRPGQEEPQPGQTNQGSVDRR